MQRKGAMGLCHSRLIYSIGSDLISKPHPAKLEERTGILTLYDTVVTVYTNCLNNKGL